MAKLKKKETKKQIKQTKSLCNKKNSFVVRNNKRKKPVSHKKKQVGNGSKPVERDKHGRIKSGSGSNGGGRPKGSLLSIRTEQIRQSVSRVESSLKGKKAGGNCSWLDYQILKSYEDTTLAVAVLARLYPALKSIEQVTFAADLMEDEEATQIRKEMKERFKG